MKVFIFNSLQVVFPVFIALVIVNYFGDAAKLFSKNFERNIVEIIDEGFNVTNITNYDERLFQKEFINRIKKRPNILILGSSRSMEINGDYFNDTNVINISVSGASIEDVIAIYQLYVLRKILPKTIIISVEPWTFNEKSGQTRWKSLSQEYNSFFQRDISGIEIIHNKY